MINDFLTNISIEEKLIDGMKLETRLEMEKKSSHSNESKILFLNFRFCHFLFQYKIASKFLKLENITSSNRLSAFQT